MKDLDTRAEIEILVRTFYGKIREHEVLAPFFARITDWEAHFTLLTDFWESNLLFRRTYRGNPARAHIQVDNESGNAIEPKHFGLWLNVWLATVDELYEGPKAEMAKERARRMSTFLHMHIGMARNKK